MTEKIILPRVSIQYKALLFKNNLCTTYWMLIIYLHLTLSPLYSIFIHFLLLHFIYFEQIELCKIRLSTNDHSCLIKYWKMDNILLQQHWKQHHVCPQWDSFEQLAEIHFNQTKLKCRLIVKWTAICCIVFNQIWNYLVILIEICAL